MNVGEEACSFAVPRRGVSAFLMGSVTTKVLGHATVPVLVYRS